jgi:hypothetical protein
MSTAPIMNDLRTLDTRESPSNLGGSHEHLDIDHASHAEQSSGRRPHRRQSDQAKLRLFAESSGSQRVLTKAPCKMRLLASDGCQTVPHKGDDPLCSWQSDKQLRTPGTGIPPIGTSPCPISDLSCPYSSTSRSALTGTPFVSVSVRQRYFG